MKKIFGVMLMGIMSLASCLWASQKEEVIVIQEEPIKQKSSVSKDSQQRPDSIGSWCSIKLGEKKFVVSQEFLNQCAAYKAEGSFYSSQPSAQKEIKTQDKQSVGTSRLTRSVPHVDRASLLVQKARKKIKTDEKLIKEWDITPMIELVFFPPRKELAALFQEKMPAWRVKEFRAAEKKSKEAGDTFLGMSEFKPLVYIYLKEKYKIDVAGLIQSVIDSVSSKKTPAAVHDQDELFMMIKMADLLGNDTVMQVATYALMEKFMGKQPLVTTFEGHTNQPRGVLFIPQSDQFLSWSHDGTVKLWDMKQKKLLRTFGKNMARAEWEVIPINGVLLLPDGQRFLAWGADNTIKLWEIKTGKLLHTFAGHTKSVDGVLLFFDGEHFLSWSADKMLIEWELKSGTVVHKYSGHSDVVKGALVLPDGKRFMSWSLDRSLRLWDRDSGKELRTYIHPLKAVDLVILLPEQQQLLAWTKGWDSNCTIDLWDLESGQLVRTFAGHKRALCGVQVLPNGKQFLSWSEDATIKLWDRESQRALKSFVGHKAAVKHVALLPDGQRFLSVSYDKTIKLWDIKTGALVRTFEGHRAFPEQVIVLADGHQFLSRDGYLGEMIHWNINYTQPMRTFLSDKRHVTSIAVTPDARQYISCSYENMKLWDLFDCTFEQIALCYQIFTSTTKTKLVPGGSDYATFLSLPQSIRDDMIQRKKVNSIGV